MQRMAQMQGINYKAKKQLDFKLIDKITAVQHTRVIDNRSTDRPRYVAILGFDPIDSYTYTLHLN
jgi:hypothetical protein